MASEDELIASRSVTPACSGAGRMVPTRRLRIAVTVDPEIPVPPLLYGGFERIVDMVVRGLVEQGHDVTLFAHPNSEVPCALEPYPARRSQGAADLARNMWHVSSTILRRGYDLVHNFARLAYLLPVLPLHVPKLMTYGRHITARSVLWGERLARGTLHFTGCSRHIMEPYAGRQNWHVVYHGVPRAAYEFREEVGGDAPLVFLGRVVEIKGAHLAIEVARRSGRGLLIAGNVPDFPQHRAYFEERIAPHVDGSRIRYVGPVADRQKNELLGQAAALLMPILWEEPFGIVMAEALACGTPVIGLRRGAVPEVVEDGVTGFVCKSVDEIVAAVGRLKEIDRKACRRAMEERFSDRAIVGAYVDLYWRLIHDVARR